MVLVLWEIRDRQAPGKRRLIFATSSDVLLLQKIQRIYKNLWKAWTWYTYYQKYIFVYYLTISLLRFDFNVKYLILWAHIEILRGKNGSKKKLNTRFVIGKRIDVFFDKFDHISKVCTNFGQSGENFCCFPEDYYMNNSQQRVVTWAR